MSSRGNLWLNDRVLEDFLGLWEAEAIAHQVADLDRALRRAKDFDPIHRLTRRNRVGRNWLAFLALYLQLSHSVTDLPRSCDHRIQRDFKSFASQLDLILLSRW